MFSQMFVGELQPSDQVLVPFFYFFPLKDTVDTVGSIFTLGPFKGFTLTAARCSSIVFHLQTCRTS